MIVDGTIRNAQLSAIATRAGASPKLQFWSGTKPSDPATVPGGTLLAEITLGSTPFSTPSGNSMAVSGVPLSDSSADATGTCTFARLVQSGGTGVALFSYGTSGTDLVGASTSFVAGTAINLTGLTINQPTGTI